jgi:hypothetical protein
MVRRSAQIALEATRLSTGSLVVHARVELFVRSQDTRFRPLQFLVDSGAGIATISTLTARRANLVLPTRSTLIALNTAAGRVFRRIYAGHFVVRVPGIPGREYLWPCHFIEHPTRPSEPILRYPWLGFGRVLTDLRITFDGGYSLSAPHGSLILEEAEVR